jgi:hypothetical protein
VKPPVTNKVVYIHENATFINMMVAIIHKSFLHRDLLIGGLDEDRRLRPGTPFTLEYTIPHNTTFKDIKLVSESDWEMFVEKMKDTAKGGGKLTIKEKVNQFNSCSLTELISYRPIKQLKFSIQLQTTMSTHPKRRKRKGESYLQRVILANLVSPTYLIGCQHDRQMQRLNRQRSSSASRPSTCVRTKNAPSTAPVGWMLKIPTTSTSLTFTSRHGQWPL